MLAFLKNKYSSLYLVLQPLSTAFDVGAAYVLMVAIDFATSGTLEKWPLYVAGVLSYITLQFCVDLITKRIQEKAVTTALAALRTQLMRKILSMSTQAYTQKNSGTYIAYITKNTEKIDSLFFRKLFDFYPQLLQFTASVCLLFILDWRLALFVLIASSIQILVPKCLVSVTGKAQSASTKMNEKYTVAVKEIFEAFDVIKSYNLQQKIEILHQNANDKNVKMLLKSTNLDWFTNILSHLLSGIVYFGVFFLGAILVLLGVFKISVIIAASQLVIFIVFPLGALTRNITSIFAAKKIGTELHDILKQEEPELPFIKKTSFDTGIVLNGVGFAYHNDSSAPVFSDVNLSIKKGEKILIVGKSGAGKSTLAHAMSTAIIKKLSWTSYYELGNDYAE